jgi:hypothetical protein
MEREEMRWFILFRLIFAPKSPAPVTAKTRMMTAPPPAGAREDFTIRENFDLLAIWSVPPPIREDLKVLLYQSQEADNTFITSDGSSPYNSSR